MPKKYFLSIILPTIFFASSATSPFLFCISLPAKDAGVFKSFDGGQTWEQKVAISKSQNIASVSILKIAVDPQNSNILYLGTKGNGLAKSMDGGELWYPLVDRNGVLDKRANVISIAVNPKNSNYVYVGAYQNRFGVMLRSSDAGKSWEEVYRTAREGYAVFAVEIDSLDPAVVFMGTAEGGFLKSIDYGRSWKAIKWFDDVINDVKINPLDNRIIYVNTLRSGLFKTNDRGQTWQNLESIKEFPEAQEIETLAIDQRSPQIIYTGSKLGFLKSLDAGQTWQKINIIIPPQALTIQAIALNPFNPATMYYAAENIVYRSLDNGQTWSVQPINSSQIINVLTIDPKNPKILYAGMYVGTPNER